MTIRIEQDAIFPEWNYFLNLAEKLSNNQSVQILRGQKSNEGRDLIAFAIGHGKKIIGVTSGAHADEPVGVLTQVYLMDLLLNHPRYTHLLNEYTFLCQPLVDPDGYVLNSTWFKNPLNFKDYFLHNYRNNKPAEDCEHGIPFQKGQISRPEMVFVKNNIDKFKGNFEYYVTLHSSHVLPGACFVFDQDHQDTQLRNKISNLCHKYSLPLMDYKVKGDDTMKYLGPGFIGSPTVKTLMDRYKNNPEILSQIKMTTYEYAQTVGGAKSAYISELPIWLSTGFDNYNDSKMSMNELKSKQFYLTKEYLQQLEKIESELTPLSISESNPWYSSLKMSIKRGKFELQNAESKLETYDGFAQELEVKELLATPVENAMKAYKYAIKSTEIIHRSPISKSNLNDIVLNEFKSDQFVINSQTLRKKYLNLFNTAANQYEKIMGLKNLSIKTQVEIQLGLIFSGIENVL